MRAWTLSWSHAVSTQTLHLFYGAIRQRETCSGDFVDKYREMSVQCPFNGVTGYGRVCVYYYMLVLLYSGYICLHQLIDIDRVLYTYCDTASLHHSVGTAVSLILTATLWDTGFKCKSCTKFMCLINNHFVTVTIMYYSSLQVNYMVAVCIR